MFQSEATDLLKHEVHFMPSLTPPCLTLINTGTKKHNILSYFQTKYAFHRKKIQEKVTKKKIPNRITKARKENEVVSKALCCEIIKMASHTKKLIPNAVKIRPLIKRRGSINHESKNKIKNCLFYFILLSFVNTNFVERFQG